MRFGVVVFPGSNCEMDCHHVIDKVLREDVDYVWHQQTDVSAYDCLVLPGGFSYGDYLRCGAIARFSPVMEAVADFAAEGGLVIGICNGFQILLEAGLLPGAMLRNTSLSFICRFSSVRVENADTPWTNAARQGQVLRVPIAHGEGNYTADEATLAALAEEGRIILRYCGEDGEVTAAANPNGSVDNIAGICGEGFNVFGLMPHPERASEEILGSTDGLLIWESVMAHYRSRG
ncbi:MAG: phosphoribosylformylglycinamidine synthase subunit PurQ [Actinomycetota bacterium]|nr:phosphoribosylformylglycinamidine synthase subunit PurQ [Actinomycetota bacterium]MDD5666260.1 phosphoribosylformylglycinamidine synthase subunit PurQ [Actinomycetota bacterium]